MSDLVHFEFRRLLRRASLYVCFGISMLFILFVLQSLFQDHLYRIDISMMSVVKQMITAANLPIMIIIFTSIFVCEDKERGTIKTIYSLGFSRWQLFFARFLASVVAVVAMFLTVILIGLTAGLFFQSYAVQEDSASDVAIYIIWEFTSLLAQYAFYFLIAELSQKIGLSIVLGIFGTSIVSICVNTVFTLIAGIVNENKQFLETVNEICSVFNMYWMPTLATSFMSLFGYTDGINYLAADLVNTGYVLLFAGLSLLITYKREIKN